MRRPYALVGVGLAAVILVGGGLAVTAHHRPSRPGAIDPRVTQTNIQQTICLKGYTATVRPPTSYTGPIKLALIAKLPASASHNPADYELDHQVPLEVGGAPTDTRNLVLQPWVGPTGAHAKDFVENKVHAQVCSGALTLAEGQRCFLVDWTRCQ
jgi:hypothetical protein